MADIITDEDAQILASINKGGAITPEEVKIDAENDAIVNSMLSGAASGSAAAKNTIAAKRTNLGPGGASQYDVGYTSGKGPLDRYRGTQQSAWDQFANRTATVVPNIAYGVIELAGHILNTPDNIYGWATNGKSLDGGDNDFNNHISEWAAKQSEQNSFFGAGEFKNYAKDPNNSMDFSDSSFYINAGFDLFESISEFMLTGMGVAKIAGAASKGIGALTKSIINTDMLGAGIKMSEKAANASSRVFNSAATSESVAALNASQVFKSVQAEMVQTKKPDGTYFTEQEAREFASKAAASTFGTTLITSTALNYTSLAPFAKKNMMKTGINPKGKTISQYEKMLEEVLADKIKLEAGKKTASWYAGLLRESGQEGLEEVTENIASDIGTRSAEEAAGLNPDFINIMSAENALAFTLGALGGGFVKGYQVGLPALERRMGKGDQDNSYQEFVEAQLNATKKHRAFMNKIQDLNAVDMRGKSSSEINNHTIEMADAEMGMISNSISHGIEDGTVRIMEQEIKNSLELDDVAAEAQGVDKDRLRLLDTTIKKHKNLAKNIASISSKPGKMQQATLNASIMKDLYSHKTESLRGQLNEMLSSYIGPESENAMAVNRLQSLEAMDKSKLTTEQKKEMQMLDDHVNQLSEAEIVAAQNSDIVDLNTVINEMQSNLKDVSEDFSRLNNPDTAEDHYDSIEAKFQAEDDAIALSIAADNRVKAAESLIEESNSVLEIEEAIASAKAVLGSKHLSKAEKEGLRARIEAIETIAIQKTNKLRNDNKKKNRVDKASAEDIAVATKINNGEELSPEEIEYNEANTDRVRKVASDLKALAKDDKVKVEDPPVIEGEDGSSPSTQNTTSMENEADTVIIPEDLDTVTDEELFGTLSEVENESSAGDKVSAERPATDVASPDSNPNPTAEKEYQQNPQSSVDADAQSATAIVPDEEISTFQKQIRYHKFYDTVNSKKVEIKDPKKKRDKAEQLLNTQLADQAAGRGHAGFQKLRIALISDQIRRYDSKLQRDIFIPKLDMNRNFEPHELKTLDTDRWTPVDQIFEAKDGFLLINTTDVLPGQEVEIVNEGKWNYASGTETNLLVYRIINGKRATKPLAELPYQNIEQGSLTDKVRQDFESGRKTSPVRAYISGKNYGDLITESKPNGDRAENPISSTITSNLPMTFGYVNEDGQYDLGKGFSPDRYTNPEHRKAVTEFHQSFVKPTTRTLGLDGGQGRASGTQFILTIAPNGKVVPVYMDAKTLGQQDVDYLMGRGESEGQVRNLYDILSEGRGEGETMSSRGIVNLKKLMVMGSTYDNDISNYIKESGDRKKIFATPDSIIFRSDIITKSNPRIPENSWVRVTYNVPNTEYHPLNDMLNGKDFKYQVFGGENFEMIPGETTNWFNAKGETIQSLKGELNDIVADSKYNVSKDFLNNSGNFVDVYNNPTGVSYNEYAEKMGQFSTDVTGNKQKFINSSIKLRLVNSNSNTNDLTHQIEPTVTQSKVIEEAADRTVIGVSTATEPTADLDQAAKKKVDNITKARRKNSDYSYLRSPDLDRGMASMSQPEVDWVLDAIGPNRLQMVKGVDRVLTIGGRKALGYFNNGMVTLASEAEMGTGYHEAFHFVFHMALDQTQRAQILRQGKKRYGSLGEVEMEEALAEDFRAFMLERESVIRPSAIQKFFKNLVSYITRVIGMNPNRKAVNKTTDLNGFYEQIATREWKSVYKDQFGVNLEPTIERFKLIDGFDRSEQNDIITDSASELVKMAKDQANDYETFADVISNRKRLKDLIKELRLNMSNLVLSTNKKADALADVDRDLTAEEDQLLLNNYFASKALQSWSLTDEQKKDINPAASFEVELLKSLNRYGFQVSVQTTFVEQDPLHPINPANENSIKIEKDTDSIEDLHADDVDVHDQQAHMYNMDVTLKDTKKTLSAELRRRLSMLPKYKTDKNGDLIKRSDGTYETELNMFGNPLMHNFNTAYSNIKSILADTPIQDIYATIAEEANVNPLFAAIHYNMQQEISKDSTADKHWDGFISEFMSAFNNSTYDLVTIKSGAIDKRGPQLIFVDRATIYRRINDKWEQAAQSKGLVDIEYKPNQKAWSTMHTEYKAELVELGFQPDYDQKGRGAFDNKAMAIAKKYLAKTGLDINPKALPDVFKRAGSSWDNVLRGKNRPSIESIIARGAKGKEAPFGKDILLNIFSKPQSKFENDVNSGTAFANGKQVHTINMESFISNVLNNIKSDFKNGKEGFINMLSKDEFYNPDSSKPHLRNKLLEHWSNPDNLKDTKFIQFFDFKDGKEGREYINTNFNDSILQKIIGASSSRDIGYFSLGTLSDKLKNIGIPMPTATNLVSATDNLKDAYIRTAHQELTRIKKVRNSKEFAKRYKHPNKDKFVYLPELNSEEFAPLLSRITKGDMSIKEFNSFFDEKVVPAIEAKIDKDMKAEMDRLSYQGILEYGEDGYKLTDDTKKHLSTNDKAGLEIIQKFLIEDRMWKMEMSKVFMGDMAKYKGFWDYFKRMYQIVTPGRKAYVNNELENASHKSTMNRLIIKSPRSTFDNVALGTIAEGILSEEGLVNKAQKEIDFLIESEKNGKPLSTNQVEKHITKIAKRGKDGPKIANAVFISYSYRSNNRGDSASFISIAFFKDQKKGLGEWKPEYDWIYDNVWEAAVTVEQATKGMTPEQRSYYKAKDTKLTADILKPFYYGPRTEKIVDPETGNEMNNILYEQFKDSMAPILPIWGKKVSGFDWMIKQFDRGVDVISTDDTVKQGEFNANEMGDSDQAVDDGLRTGIPTSYLRYPQVPAKIKDTALAGTQLQKIIMSNLNPSAKYDIDGGISAKQLSDKYHSAFSKKIKNSYDKVLNSLGIESENELYNIDNMTGDKKIKFLINLRSIVEESVISQGKSESLVEALKIIKTAENSYDYELGMSFGPYARSFQNMIMSIVRSNVLRQELPGGSMVNMADLSVSEDDQLKFVRYENGKVLPAEIAMPHVHAEKLGVGWGVFTTDGKPTLDEKGNVLYENLTEEQTEALKTVIYRIPTQMKSSALPTIIKRIMPPSDGAKMMIPGEMTTQAGLDFDFDKSFMLFKAFGEDSNPADIQIEDMNNDQLDNTIFDTHWAVLTSQAHFEELVTPISSRAHESMLESMVVDEGSTMNDTDPFNPVTNIEMEGLAKYSHIMRGTFSKFASGHNVMTNLVTALGEDESINDYISTSIPVNIVSGRKGYLYNEFGRQKDSDGKYISENHSENLNSALDSQNNPILGRLNTSVFNSMATGYMLDLGVPDRVVKKFMNSRVLKNLSHVYFQKGGTPYVLNDAIEQVVKDMNLGTYYAIQKDTNKNIQLTEDMLSDQSITTEAQILSDFVKYQRSGQDLSKLNDMLSPETQKISDAAGLREWMSKSRVLANGTLIVNPDLFSLEKTPLKKIGAFHQYGMNLSKSLMNGLFPYFTNYYDATINKIIESQNINSTLNWKTADKLHSAIDMLSLSKAAMQQDADVINMASAGFSDRISLYKDQGKQTIVDRYDYITKKYPKILDNKFVAVLGKDKYNNRNETQLLTFPNASDNNDQQEIMGDFEGMLASPNDDIRGFAKDLVAYTIATSGFSNNSFSFIMSIPTSFWTNSSIAPLMKLAKKNSQGYGSEEIESMEAIVRSIGRESSIVPSFEIKEGMIRKKKDGKISHIVLPLGSSILNLTNIDSSPQFIKRYDTENKKHVLYKRRDNIRGSETGLAYAEISFFGEANRSHEMFNPYILTADSESKVPGNAARNVSEGADVRNEIANLDNIPTDLRGIEEQDSGMYSSSEMDQMHYQEFLNSTLDPEDGTMNIMPALSGTTITKEFSDELDKRLDEFLANNNIKVEIVDSLKDRFGIDAAGVADAINQAIYLAKGKEGRLSKPEEVAHIYIESTLDSRQTQKMLKEAEGTEEYNQVKERYNDIYNGDDNRIRREAAAKILAKALVEPDAYKKANRNALQRAIDAFMNMIKRLFGKVDVYNMATMDIIKGAVLNGKANSDQVMFNLAGEDNLNEEEVIRQYRLLAADEEAYEQKVMENFVKSANQITKGETDISMDEVIAFLKSDEKASARVAKVMEDIKDVIDAKIYRLNLKATSKNNIGDVEGLKKLKAEINNANDSVAMIAYIQDINIRINKMKDLFKSRGENITNEDLMEMDQELKSYNNINYVANQLGKLEGGAVLAKVEKEVGNIMTQKGFLEEEIAERSNTITSALLSELTTENITASQIAEQMRKAPKDVSFMSKWMRPGMDSADVLVRMTSKLINDAKNEANKEFYDMVNSGPESLHRIVRAYALDAEKKGVKVANMQELNKDLITELNGKLYLVNKQIGKEKYDQIMKLDSLDPKRMYYDKLVSMYIGSQNRVAKITGKVPFGYELPHIRKSKRERSAKGAAKEFLQDFTVRVDDDVDGYIGESAYIRDENNNLIKDSPLFYQGKMEIDEISRDIAATIASSTHNLLQYDHLNDQKANLWAIQKAANDRKVKESKPGTIYKAANSLLTKVGAKDIFKTEEANSTHQINMIIDQQLYGQTRKDAGGFNFFGKYVPWNKVSDLVKKFTSSKIMMFNFNIAASNFFTGEAMMIQEAIGGGYFTVSDYKKGGKIASQQYGGLMQDIYGTGVSNKLSGMLQFMNLENDFKLAHKKFGQLSSGKGRALNIAASSGRAFQEVSQAYVMAHTVAATSQNIQVQDASGNDYSLWDVIEIEDGKMSMKKGMTYRGKPLDGQMNNLRERMVFIHESMHGVYNKLDAPAFNANIVGQQMLMMRGWLYSQMTRRTDLTRFNERLGGFTEGNFISTTRLIKDSFKTLGALDGFTSMFYTSQKAEALLLTEEERIKYKEDTSENKFVKDDIVKMRKGNIRKTRAELGMVLALMILNSLLWDDDDEETQGEAFARYHLLRLNRELFFYNPSELLEIAKNPTINANLIKDGIDIISFWDDLDVIESGEHKGKIKLFRTIEKQIPGWNQYAAWGDLSRKADAIEQGFR